MRECSDYANNVKKLIMKEILTGEEDKGLLNSENFVVCKNTFISFITGNLHKIFSIFTLVPLPEN